MTLKKLAIPILLVIIIGIVAAIYGKWDWLIWGIFLLCPLMHLFGHDHSGHNHSKGRHSGHHH
ncbi:DUF2933 domain-containing protein [Niallia sp. Sow4_A1]|uniref:DUF2933 domain-containing protein n=1 Tax=Niallia hominis TaxID=3133173 RepID=A0ABV1F121_9BACI|nr:MULTISPECIES: DUF2933 domain-containing protein [Bacillaceae]MCM3364398.1 DUF2933 domain-containing protein [Niallia sp. MER TA 168]